MILKSCVRFVQRIINIIHYLSKYLCKINQLLVPKKSKVHYLLMRVIKHNYLRDLLSLEGNSRPPPPVAIMPSPRAASPVRRSRGPGVSPDVCPGMDGCGAPASAGEAPKATLRTGPRLLLWALVPLWRVVMTVRRVIKPHFQQPQPRKGHSLAWPLSRAMMPWCRHRVHLGPRGCSAALDRDILSAAYRLNNGLRKLMLETSRGKTPLFF